MEYHQSRPGLKVLQQQIDEFITAHEEKLEEVNVLTLLHLCTSLAHIEISKHSLFSLLSYANVTFPLEEFNGETSLGSKQNDGMHTSKYIVIALKFGYFL